MRIGIVGMGAVGAAVAARLLSSGRTAGEVGLAAGSDAAAAALRAGGLRLSVAAARRLPGRPERPAFVRGEELIGLSAELPRRLAPYRLVLLCTRAEATRAAVAAALPLLARDGSLVCLQNGLPEEAVAALAGRERTFGAVINWSATALRPGEVELTGRGDLLLGAAAPGEDGLPRLSEIAAVLGAAFPVRVTDNLAGARWSKLALNCAVSTLGALSGLPFGALSLRAEARALALRAISEVVQVAAARGVRLERVSGLDPRWLSAGKVPLPLRHALFLLAGRARPRQRSGMLDRLLAGRTSGQIDDLNGAVVREAAKVGVPVPVNQALLDLVHALERGEDRPGTHHLAALRDRLLRPYIAPR